MCLNQRFIRTQSKNLSLKGGQSFVQVQKCGHCAECIAEKRDEWYFRAWYETQSCIAAGGYVLFDTLTYAPEHVPHISDFIDFDKLRINATRAKYDYMCFSKDDISLFFKRLRQQLKRDGFKSSDCIKYFLTSEYGTSDEGTHRPHYHFLCFVYDPRLNPLTLSNYIDKCWQLGRTDGVPYKSANYVLNKRVFKDMSNKQHLLSTCCYVSKYITKDYRFLNQVKYRVNFFMKKLFGSDWMQKLAFDEDLCVMHRYTIPSTAKEFDSSKEVSDDNDLPWDEEKIDREVLMSASDVNKFYKSIVGLIDQFHLQSNGFGADVLKYNSIEDIMRTGLIKMEDRHKGVKFLQVPRYYQVKLFYDLHKDFNGHFSYCLNERGIEYKKLRQASALNTMTDKLEAWRICMYEFNYYCDLPSEQAKSWYLKNITQFDRLNDGRSLRDFVEYLIYYKGRIKSDEQLAREHDGVFRVEPLDKWIDLIYKNVTKEDVVYNYNTPSDKEYFGTKFISKKHYGDAQTGYLPPMDALLYVEGMSPNWFELYYVIDEKSDPRFRDYDKMYSIWCNCQKYKNKFRQQGFDSKEQIKQKFKESLTIATILPNFL